MRRTGGRGSGLEGDEGGWRSRERKQWIVEVIGACNELVETSAESAKSDGCDAGLPSVASDRSYLRRCEARERARERTGRT